MSAPEERLEGIAQSAARRLVKERPVFGFALLVYDSDGHYAFTTNDGYSRAAEALLRAVLVRIGDEPDPAPDPAPAKLSAAERRTEELAAEVERLKAKLTPTRTVRREVDLRDDEEDTRRDCTCLGACKGAAGLGTSWRCVMEKGAQR